MVFDILIITILCIFSACGYKKGMLSSVFSIFIFVLSIYTTYLIIPYVSNLIMSVIPIKNLSASWINVDNLNMFIQNNTKISILLRFILHSGDALLSDNILHVVLNSILFIVLNIIIRALLKIVCSILIKQLKKYFVLGSLDKLCGVLFGFAKGLLIASIICFIVISIADLNLFNQDIIGQINQSTLVSVLAGNTSQIINTIVNMKIVPLIFISI